jgi:regulatory protein
MSKRLIAQELKQKGIAADIISEVVADIDDDAEYQLAYALAERKFRASAGLAPEKIYGRLASLLARKGFSSQTISAVYRELTEENGEENLEH